MPAGSWELEEKYAPPFRALREALPGAALDHDIAHIWEVCRFDERFRSIRAGFAALSELRGSYEAYSDPFYFCRLFGTVPALKRYLWGTVFARPAQYVRFQAELAMFQAGRVPESTLGEPWLFAKAPLPRSEASPDAKAQLFRIFAATGMLPFASVYAPPPSGMRFPRLSVARMYGRGPLYSLAFPLPSGMTLAAAPLAADTALPAVLPDGEAERAAPLKKTAFSAAPLAADTAQSAVLPDGEAEYIASLAADAVQPAALPDGEAERTAPLEKTASPAAPLAADAAAAASFAGGTSEEPLFSAPARRLVCRDGTVAVLRLAPGRFSLRGCGTIEGYTPPGAPLECSLYGDGEDLLLQFFLPENPAPPLYLCDASLPLWAPFCAWYNAERRAPLAAADAFRAAAGDRLLAQLYAAYTAGAGDGE